MEEENKPSEPEEDEPASPSLEGPYVEISGGNAYVRLGPNTTYSAIGTVHSGDKITYANSKEWVPIIFNEQIGWVSNKYAKVKN